MWKEGNVNKGSELTSLPFSRRPVTEAPRPQSTQASKGTEASPLDVPLDVLADRSLACPLANLGDVGTGEAVGELGECLKVDVGGDGRLAQHRLEDLRRGEEGAGESDKP